MKNKRSFYPIPLALGIAVSAAGTVHAQSKGLEEVIVTAERREASLQETDISLTVLGAQTLQEMGVTTANDVSDFVPNVKIHEMPGKMGASINIRGFRNAETIATFDPKVALYLDGVLISKSTGAAFDVLDLERIEVLRGPQGTLYGRNTVGGAVNLITKKPSDEVGGKFSMTLGDYSQQDMKATFNAPLLGPNGLLGQSESRLNLKATLASLQRDGYWDNDYVDAPNDELGDKDRRIGHVQLQWAPNDALSFLYAYDDTDIDETGWPLVLTDYNKTTHPQLEPYVSDGDTSNIPLDGEQRMKGEAEGHSLTVDWGLTEGLSLVSITAYRTFKVDNLADSDGTPEWVFHTASGDDVEDFTQELRLVGSAMDSRLDYVVGAYYMDEDINDSYTINILPRAGRLESGTHADAQNEIWAVFGEATYGLTERLDLTLGVRYTEEDREMSRTDTLVIPAAGTDSATRLPDQQQDFDDTSGTASISYRWTDDIMTYLKASRGYASGGFNPRSPDVPSWGLGYDEETVWTYEFGWKTTWLDRRLLVNGAVFYSDYQDLQVTVLTPTGRNNLTNASDAEIKGAELEIEAQPVDNLTLGGSFAYLDPQYKDYVLPTTGEDVSDLYDWAHSPDNTYSAFGRYVVPGFLSTGDLVFRVDYAWVDDFTVNNAPGNEVDGYEVVNARIGLDNIQGPDNSVLSIGVWGKNLADEVYYTSGYNLTAALGFQAHAIAPPRTYGVDLVLEF